MLMDDFLKKKIAVFEGFDSEDVDYPITSAQMKIEVEFETLEELTVFIKKKFKNMFHFKNGRMWFIGNYPCTLNLNLILNYNESAVSKEMDEVIASGDIEGARQIEEWLIAHPVEALYEDNSRTGLVGDYIPDVTDPDHYYEKLKSLCGDGAIK